MLKFLGRGATFIQGATSIPDSRVQEYLNFVKYPLYACTQSNKLEVLGFRHRILEKNIYQSVFKNLPLIIEDQIFFKRTYVPCAREPSVKPTKTQIDFPPVLR